MTVRYQVADDCFTSRMSDWAAPGGTVPTQMQLDIARLLFHEGDRHLTSEDLLAEALLRDLSYDQDDIDRAMQTFVQAGWVRKLAIDTENEIFDTNLSDHHHFFDPATGTVSDIPKGCLTFDDFPEAPEGMELVNVDVVVTVRPKQS